MRARLFLPRDTTAVALGADRVARALVQEAQRRGLSVDLVRNGSRGLFWLEPLLEVEQDGVRIAFGPLDVAAVPALCDALATNPAEHPLCLGPVEDIPYLKSQQRLTFARVGQGDPLCLDTYRALAGFAGLQRALRLELPGHRQCSHRIRPARAGRRGISRRHQVADRAGYPGRAKIYRLQCGRGRFRHLRRSPVDGGGPLPAASRA